MMQLEAHKLMQLKAHSQPRCAAYTKAFLLESVLIINFSLQHFVAERDSHDSTVQQESCVCEAELSTSLYILHHMQHEMHHHIAHLTTPF